MHIVLQVSELDETMDRLESRCNRFVKGSKFYKEGISSLSTSQTQFADFLEEFCGGTDEESMMLGEQLSTAMCLKVSSMVAFVRKEVVQTLLCI